MSLSGPGIFKLARELGLRISLLDEDRTTRVVELNGKVHRRLRLPRVLFRCEHRVFIPKLKLHSQTGLSGALKLSMGLVGRSARLLGHNYQLDEKLVDLYQVVKPDLIVVDGVVVGAGGAGAPQGFGIGIIVIGRNSVAVDAVCARILGLDPYKIEHIRLAHELGYGPIEIREIAVAGDLDLPEAERRARMIKPLDPTTLFPQIRTFFGGVQGWLKGMSGWLPGVLRGGIIL